MAQHDYVIANGTGAAVRSDLNNGLAAIVSQNSGTTEPTTTYAYMRWADTTAGVMKMRNGANNAWITLYQLDGEWSTIAFENGSASAPSIYFKDSGTDTGIYSPGTDQVAISTAGTGRLFVDSSGRVGLGSSSPQAILEMRTAVPGLRDIDNALRISTEASGTDALGAIGTGITFAQRWQNAANNVRVGGVFGIKTASTSNYGGGVSLYYQAASDVDLAPGLTLNHLGNVGIGSTVPGRLLTVNGDFGINNGGGGGGAEIFSVTNASGSPLVNATNNATALTFGYNGTEGFRLDSSRRLLVGTSSSLVTSALIQGYKSSGEVQCLIKSDSIANTEVVVFSANAGGRLSQFGVYKHSGITNPCSYYYLEQQNGTGQVFWVDDSGNFRISTSGNNIGTTGGTVVGTQTSDERLKNILGPVTYGLGTLKQIEPVRYTLKSQPDIEQLGFIAQQVQPLVPQSVFDTNEHIEGEPEDAPTKLGMEYVALIPVLVNAVKELSAEVDALKAQLQAL